MTNFCPDSPTDLAKALPNVIESPKGEAGMSSTVSAAVLRFGQDSTVRNSVSEKEWATRVELAAAYRLVAHFGWDDLIFTHISARVPDEPYLLINPFGLLFEEITASSLVKVDKEGNKVLDSPHIVSPPGFILHSMLHAGRSDANCVLHLHTIAGQAVASQRDGLLPLTQTAMLIAADVAYHDFEGVATNDSEGERLLAALGDRTTLILRNHGTLTLGEDVASAFMRIYFLERACQAQLAALTGSGELSVPRGPAMEKTAEYAHIGLQAAGRALAWPALIRKLERIDPSYKE